MDFIIWTSERIMVRYNSADIEQIDILFWIEGIPILTSKWSILKGRIMDMHSKFTTCLDNIENPSIPKSIQIKSIS
jgi:hypothetical protein